MNINRNSYWGWVWGEGGMQRRKGGKNGWKIEMIRGGQNEKAVFPREAGGRRGGQHCPPMYTICFFPLTLNDIIILIISS